MAVAGVVHRLPAAAQGQLISRELLLPVEDWLAEEKSVPEGLLGHCRRPGFAGSEGQREVGASGVQDTAKIRLNPLERRGVIGLEAQHHHWRGVRRPCQAEAVGILDTEPVEGDDLERFGERGVLPQFVDQRRRASPSCMPMLSSASSCCPAGL